MRRLCTLVAACGAAAFVLASGHRPSPLYVWNASESVPIGLYRVRAVGRLELSELVAVQPPEPLAALLDLNGYLPNGLPMLKRVLALSKQTVCRTGRTIFVDGIEAGAARERDGQGRRLPDWQGCRVIHEDEVFLMNWQSAGSFDGRYFGPISRSAVIGQALPVWTRRE